MDTVLLDQPRPHIARITLNRPRVLNALNDAMLTRLRDRIQEVNTDPSIHAVILTGAGRAFSSGFDLKEEASGGHIPPEDWVDRFADSWKVFRRIWESPKPTIASVRGYNLGGSLELSMLCDITVAADSTAFALPEIRHGQGPGPMLLPWLVPMKSVKYLALTGDSINADEALRLGLVTCVVDDSDLESATLRIATKLSKIPPQAMKLNKAAINRTYERAGLFSSIDDNLTISTVVMATSEAMALEQDRLRPSLHDYFKSRDGNYA